MNLFADIIEQLAELEKAFLQLNQDNARLEAENRKLIGKCAPGEAMLDYGENSRCLDKGSRNRPAVWSFPQREDGALRTFNFDGEVFYSLRDMLRATGGSPDSSGHCYKRIPPRHRRRIKVGGCGGAREMVAANYDGLLHLADIELIGRKELLHALHKFPLAEAVLLP